MIREEYTDQAVSAMHAAALQEHDFPGWLADALAQVAAKRGSSWALVAGRSSSWEAALVLQLLKGTVGEGDELLFNYREKR